mgnify:CR=1|jgi:hypothetical protein|tara:strand:- start:677 stop:898 length:222 start_codon:yes stop_codon:yes gene_type:complete
MKIEEQIAHHEKEARQWVEVGKTVSSLKALLLCIENANNESKEVARLVAKMNGWNGQELWFDFVEGETQINHL